MKHLKFTSVVLTIAICMSMFMPTVSVLADEASAPSETQSTEETETQKPKETVKPKETEKPAPKETEKKETEPSEKKETDATEKPAAQETEKQEPEKQEPAETEKQIPAETENTEPAETKEQEPAETKTQNPTETEKQEPVETEEKETEPTESQTPEETEEQAPEITEAPVQETEVQKESKKAITNGTCGDSMSWTLSDGVLDISGTGIMDGEPGWLKYKDQITTVNIGEGVERIGTGAFEGCSNLTKVSFPSTLQETGRYSFHDCTSLETVTVPYNVSWLANSTFSGCTKLKNVTLECNIDVIEISCFENCTSLTSIKLPDQATKIALYAFRGCTRLSSVTFPETLVDIQDEAFAGCTSLTKITVPYGVTNLGDGAFKNCTGLTSATMVSVNRIGNYAFEGCTGLKTVTIPVTVDHIWVSAFAKCSSLTDVHYGGTVSQWGDLEIAANNAPLFKATLHAKDSSSFNGASGTCGTNLTWTLGTTGTLTISGSGAMSNFDSNNYGSYYFYKAPWKAYNSIIKKVVIESGVTTIGNGAFSGCGNLTTITMHNGIVSIGRDAFVNSGILSLTIPSSMTEIAANAFENVTSLTTVTIPATVKTIGSYAFANCTDLTTVNLSNGVTRICDSAFRDCAKLETIDLPNSIKRIESSAFNGAGLTEVVIPSSIASSGFGEFAFANCLNLTKVTISSNVQKIGIDAFANCKNLKTVIIPLTVYEIGSYAFTGCTSLSDVYYEGTQDNWNNVPGSGQTELQSATKHYGSTGETLYNIQVVSCVNGSVTFSKNPAPAGEVITVTATPDEGYTFNYIDVNGTMCGTTFAMPAGNVKVKVFFSSKSYKLTVNYSSGGTASYYTNSVSAGTNVILTCTPEDGYVVDSVKINDVDNGTDTTFIMPARDTEVYVTFAQKGYDIELITDSNGKAFLNKTSANAGDKITVTATPNDGYVVDQIIVNDVPLKSGVYEFTMGAGDTTVEVTFKKAAYSVTVSVPNGGGTASANVTSAQQGEKITISYKASTGYTLDKITLNGNAIPGTTFDMPAGAAKVAVYFKRIQYTITATCSAGGTVTCSPTSAGVGETITIKPISETGYTVESVKVNNEEINGLTFDMPAKNTTVYVSFVRGGYPVNLTVGPNGDATVSKKTAGYGDKITITAEPAVGYVLDTITVDGVALDPGKTEFTMGAAETNVKVTFKKASYSINVSVSNGGGTANASVPKAGYGDTVKVTCNALSGYEFDKITVNGDEKSGTSFTMPAETANVVVYFKKIQYTVTANCSSGGTVSCSPTSAGVGEKITITAKPATGYSVGTVKVNNVVADGLTFEMPAKNTTVYVNFVKTVYNVDLTVGDNGTAYVSAEKANMGDKITVTYKPATGYILDTIKVNNTALASGENEFTMGAASVTVVVTFKKASYSVSVSVPNGGGTAKADVTNAGYGDLIKITCSASAGYEFDKITVNGVEKTGTTFNMPAEDAVVVAYFKKVDYKIELKVGDNGTATVSKDSANYGDTITVTVKPDAGYMLKTIKVNGTALPSGKMEFTMGIGKTIVEVSFQTVKYNINISVPEGGSAVTNPASASVGDTVKVIPTPDTGYELDKITLNGSTLTGREFEMPAGEANVVVYFKLIDYDINLSVGPNGTATVSKNPANYGDVITVTATPVAGYVLDKIIVNGTALKAGVTTFTMRNAAVTVSVSFKKTQYSIDVSVSGEGGTASAKTSAAAEEWIDIKCNADTGYVVDKITVNGSAITGTGFPMPAKAANVVVTFKRAVYKIALIKPVGGTATIAKTTAYYGESIAVTTKANTGYELDKIYVNGSPVSSKTSFTMPASDAEVEVVYKLIDYDIEVECGPNGTASVSKDPANYGDRIVITATPNSRYTIETIKVNGTELVGTMEFTMGNAPATVEVTFKRADYTISSSVSGGNGKISVVKMANGGDRVAVECTPNAGYTLDKILVNGNAITGTSFTMPAQDTTVEVSFKLAVYSISINKPAGGTAKLSKTSANYGEQITVTATPSTGYRLKSITVNDIEIEIDRFSMPDKNTNVVVTFEKFEYEITLNQPANGTVSVNKNPANYGDKITVTAKPSEGYTLDTIKVNGKALSSGVYTFTMGNAPAEVEVTFKKIQYSITVSYSSGGTATSDPRKAGINDLVSVICKPNNGYEVASITVNGEPGEESFLMPAKNTKVYVTFKKTDYRITLACGPNGEAGVTKDTANIGDKITVNTYPNPGYVLDFIKVNNNQITGNTFTMGAGNTTVEVHFKLKDLKVKVTALPGGTAKADVTTAKMGETVTLTVTPAEGYKLSYIMVNNKKALMAFEMGAEDAEVTVAFEKIPYNISKSVGPNGTASIDSTVAVIGELITVKVTPDENYYAIVKVNGEDIGGNTFVMPASNVSVTVTFERVSQLSAGESGKVGNATYTVTGVAPENGTGTVRLDKIEDNGTAAVVIPDTVSIKGYTYRVTSIASYALANNPSMTSLKIGAYVTSVGNYVASGCRNLTKVYGGNRLKTIGTRAFNGCSRLKSFSISSAVLSKIGAYSFNGDRSLKTIYVNKTTKLSKKGVKKSLKGSKVKTVKVKKSKVRKYKKYFTKKNCGRKVKVKK